MELEKKLIEERAKVWEQAKAILDDVKKGEADITAEQRAAFDKANADIEKLDERIDMLQAERGGDQRSAELEKRMAEFVTHEDQPKTRSVEDQVIAFVRGDDPNQRYLDVNVGGLQTVRSPAGLWEVRTLTEGTATAGGATVPTSFRALLYEHLIENSAIRQTRATVLTTDSGEAIVMPKTTAHPASGTITSEGAAMAANDPTFGQGTLNAYKYTSFVQVSSELLQDTAVNLLDYLARAFGRSLANGAGAHYITGDGSSKPLGVFAAAGTIAQVAGTASAALGPSFDNLIDLVYTVTEPYATNGEWLMRRATEGKIRKLKDNNGQYLWQPSLVVGAPNLILGYPVHTDPNVPASGTAATAVAFGDFSSFFIRDVANIRFERSDDYAFQNDLVSFRAILRTDSELLDLTGAIGTFKHGTVA